MADKLTQQITDALTKAAAQPRGLSLYSGKAEPGLFPSTAAGKTAAQKCLGDGCLRIVSADTDARTPRDLYGLTELGWNYLLDQVNPKQVLEDFVRVLETRSDEVGELLDLARKMAENLQGLKDAVARVLPSVREERIQWHEVHRFERVTSPTGDEPKPFVACDAPSAAPVPDTPSAPDLAAAVLDRLRDWSGAAGEDCPLPKLFHALTTCEPKPTIGGFHDCLRCLHTEGAIYLHPWTGPLYALPEPAYALLAGHNVAYYASLR